MPEITQKLGFDTRSASSKLASMTKKVNELNTALTKLKAQGGGTPLLSSTTKNLTKAKKKTQDFTVSWQTMARVVQTQIAIRSLNAVIEGMRKGVEQAKQLGLAIEEVQTISGRTVSSSALQQQVLDLSNQLGKPAQDLAEGLYQTLSNQVVDAGDSMQFLAEATKLATVTASETKDAVNALSSVMNSYGLEAEQVGHISGTLFKTVELGRLRLSEIADVIGRVTPLTAAMGVEWEEAAAAIAVMTRQGVKADTAITQLRAIMTKIIRPTEEMREIFHKWGVEDGKQAVETFGGLRGVLIKLNEETGGSSEAMADLLRRVRTIVGQLSLMNDGGIALAESMGKIKNATQEVNEQWDTFTQSDAFKLQKATNELNNTLTELGTKIIPSVSFGFEAVNAVVDDFSRGLKRITGQYTDQVINREINASVIKKLIEQEDADNEWFAERQRKRFEDLAASRAKYYAAARSAEFSQESDRDAAISRATKVTQAQGKEIVDIYKDATKELSSFLDSINNRIKSNNQKLANVNSQIQQRELDQRLSRETTYYGKLQVLQGELSRARQKAAAAFNQIDNSEESVKKAEAENKTALELAKQVESLAQQSGHSYTIQKAQATTNEILKSQGRIYERSNQLLGSTEAKAKSLNKEMLDGERKLEQLIKSRNKLYEDGRLASQDPKVRAEAERQLADINNQINKVITDTARGDGFFKSLGLDTNLPKLTSALSQSLDDAHKNWAEEVDRANAAFSNFEIAVKLALDPTGARGRAADALGIEKTDKQTESSFQRQVDEQALEALKQQESIQNKIGTLKNRIEKQTKNNAALLAKSNSLMEDEFDSMKQLFNLGAGFNTGLERALGLWTSQEEIQSRVEGQFKQFVKEQIGGALKFHQSLVELNKDANNGKLITEETIEAKRRELQLLAQSQQVTGKQAEAYLAVLENLERTIVNSKQLQEETKKLAPDEVSKAIKEVDSDLRKSKESANGVSEAANDFNQNFKNSQNAVRNFSESIRGTSKDFNSSANSANSVSQATSKIGSAAAAQVAGVNQLTAAYRRLAKAAAAAPSGGPATAFHGGPMARYFADGGVVRGQDTIPTMLSRGETVINSKNSKRFFSELNAMNQGSAPVYREQGGPVTNVGDVNVTVNGGESSQQTVREIGHALRREIQRGNIKLR